MKRNIIVFHLLNNYTGSPMILRNVLQELVRKDYSVELYTSDSEGFLSGIEDVKRHGNFYFRSKLRVITFFSFFISQFFLFFVILFKKYDRNSVVYVNTILPFSGILLAKVRRFPVIVHVHEDKVSPRLLNSFLFFVVNRLADHIVLVSNYLRKNHQNTGSEVSVIYNSVSQEFASYPREIKSTCNSVFNVLMLASLRPYKGVNEFLSLAKSLSNLTFCLVLSESVKDVSDFVSKVVIPNNMKIFPTQKNVHVHYQHADLVVNLSDKNSWIETFGMTILEAMNYGLPVIVPTVGGITELVQDGENGFLIDSSDLKGLIGKIRLLASEPAIWKKMSIKSVENAGLFTNEKFKSGIAELVDKFFED
ncbi:glycosyltransferase family 4 protein [Algoriphagus jejuensis]